ncbi:hypothetical protein CYMTET_20076 [Cymbomonas tetramitiformis]|uniref:Uncharacterized protein n=1 Tax=Cymbomonas tetramitiformis TaxID=36881 RepID=A0AAE0G4X4_9CHLO|nr:hypothetical protein CYMTET_20076 [Cymbomonas tetramitiformis]
MALAKRCVGEAVAKRLWFEAVAKRRGGRGSRLQALGTLRQEVREMQALAKKGDEAVAKRCVERGTGQEVRGRGIGQEARGSEALAKRCVGARHWAKRHWPRGARGARQAAKRCVERGTGQEVGARHWPRGAWERHWPRGAVEPGSRQVARWSEAVAKRCA